MKKFEKVTAPSSTPITFAPATVRTRKIEKGITGYFARDSITRKAASNTAETARRESVQPEPQPWSGAFEIAYTRKAIPPVTVTAPATSGDVRCSARLSRTNLGVSKKATTPTGTLTKKIHSQPAYLVRTPPARTPTAAPAPPSAPQIPSALLRSLPSSNVVMT